MKRLIEAIEKARRITEDFVSPEVKQQFIGYAKEIAANLKKAVNAKQQKDNVFVNYDVKQLTNDVRAVMANMALDKSNSNYARSKQFMPKQYDDILFTNGDNNTYDSEWLKMTDAQQDTIIRKAIGQ